MTNLVVALLFKTLTDWCQLSAKKCQIPPALWIDDIVKKN